MLRLKAALLIRIISRQKQYTESEEKWEREPISGQSSFSSVIMKLLWQMKCAVMRAHTLKLRFIGKSKIRFPTPPVPPRPSNGSVRRSAASRGCIAHAVHRLTWDGRVHAITRADSRETRGIVSRRGSKSLRFSPARTLFHHVSKKASRDGGQVETLQWNH